ncbi:MAG TPA: alpha/beta fold hydrolase [Spongiibacteraceae bacterium]|nr:alpha/beta fold hydrolase [Spongiibacteraceae bacterium]
MTQLSTSPVALHYRESGEGQRAVLLLHGVFGSGDNLGSVARALAADYRVISVDLRNHGSSPWSQTMDLSAMAMDVVALLDRLALPRAALLGHSLGGKVAMQVAMQHPARVARLVVADIAPVVYPPTHQAVFAGLAALDAAPPASRQAGDELLARHVTEPGVRQFLLKNLQRRDDGSYGLRLNLTALQAHYAELRAAPVGEPYAGPCLFIKGERSDYITDAHRGAMQTCFPQHRLAVVAGTGHWLHAEKPTEFNALVAEFLAEAD